eukprot:1912877-Amphidinium_carterae.1
MKSQTQLACRVRWFWCHELLPCPSSQSSQGDVVLDYRKQDCKRFSANVSFSPRALPPRVVLSVLCSCRLHEAFQVILATSLFPELTRFSGNKMNSKANAVDTEMHSSHY